MGLAGASSWPVRVTVCAVFQVVAVKVSDDGDTAPSVVSELATPSTTSPVGSVSSVTVKVARPPASVVCSRDDVDVAGATETPAVSSSENSIPTLRLVSDRPWSFTSVARSDAVRVSASTSLSTAVTTAVSEGFAVSPAAMTMVASAPTV